jgi:poly(3-hydroxybutyrate) depolymerase
MRNRTVIIKKVDSAPRNMLTANEYGFFNPAYLENKTGPVVVNVHGRFSTGSGIAAREQPLSVLKSQRMLFLYRA